VSIPRPVPAHPTEPTASTPLTGTLEGPAAERQADADELVRMLRGLPKEVSALLISVGALGLVLPGVVGAPAVVAGGLVFWPKAFGPIEGWLGRRFPKAHRQGLEQLRRYLDDLDRRYPSEKCSSP
jgi:hypothetical protein